MYNMHMHTNRSRSDGFAELWRESRASESLYICKYNELQVESTITSLWSPAELRLIYGGVLLLGCFTSSQTMEGDLEGWKLVQRHGPWHLWVVVYHEKEVSENNG